MADQPKQQQKPVESASAAPGERRAASPRLARAGESSNAEVQQALANVETARRNLEAAKKEGVADPDAEESDKVNRGLLAELGYE